MTKYQIGTGLVKGIETIILYTRGMHLDFLKVLADGIIQRKNDSNHIKIPESLMEMMEEWSYWSNIIPQVLEIGDGLEAAKINESEIKWLPPLTYPRKLICAGSNYKAHVAEMNSNLPLYPYFFLKPSTTALIGCGETVTLPEMAKMVDWEAEMAIIIGKKVRHVKGKEALECIAGYSIMNDVSARDWSKNKPAIGLDFVMSKGFDGFAPFGPLITPAEFIPDPQNLNLKLTLNGEVKQSGNTSDMVFTIQEMIEHLSSIMTLEPGDVIATGSPAGVGHGRKPPEYIKKGDYIKVEIDHLGWLENVFK